MVNSVFQNESFADISHIFSTDSVKCSLKQLFDFFYSLKQKPHLSAKGHFGGFGQQKPVRNVDF
jgi:hypothetical protein